MSEPSAPFSDEELERLSRRGRALYDETLKPLLEPEHSGQTVAIHLDSGDYAVGKNSPDALRALHGRRPDGLTMTMRIGPETEDPTLMRMLASRSLTGQRK